jgi:hypothetical protein
MSEPVNRMAFATMPQDIGIPMPNAKTTLFDFQVEFPAGSRVARITTWGGVARSQTSPLIGSCRLEVLGGLQTGSWTSYEQKQKPPQPATNARGPIKFTGMPPGPLPAFPPLVIRRVSDRWAFYPDSYPLPPVAADGTMEGEFWAGPPQGPQGNCPEGTEFNCGAEGQPPNYDPIGPQYRGTAQPPGITGGQFEIPQGASYYSASVDTTSFISLIPGGPQDIKLSFEAASSLLLICGLDGEFPHLAWRCLVEDLGPINDPRT